jgi:chromosome segregation protein
MRPVNAGCGFPVETMLKLKKVQILGFKSFCDRTDVQLAGEGIAAIVGPNGCGKSNISDAIIWVLGEQSAKSLRGIKMEDVIFAGTRDRKPTGMAEVSLTLVDPEVYDGTSDQGDSPDVTMIDDGRTITDWNEPELRARRASETEEAVAEAQPGTVLDSEDAEEDSHVSEARHGAPDEGTPAGTVTLKIRRRKFGKTPIRAGELTVTRRLFRSGDSEYLLNGKICRLRDIQDIFLGTGLGGESYAIIGQERIGQLLSAKPQDRRSIIEEAAGITRFKTKKRLAELRLESARQNLARVNDIFEEVTKQMSTLKRQAAKAERYGQIRDELRTKLRVVLASRLAQLDAEFAAATAQIAALTGQIDAQVAAIEAMDAEHTEGVRHGYALDQQIREHAATANQSAIDLERITARTSANVDRVAELSVRLESGAAELASSRAQLATLAGEQEQVRSFLDSANAEAGDSRGEAQRKQQAAQEAVRTVQAREQQTELARRGGMQLMQRISQVRNEEVQAEAALAGLEREGDRLALETETAREELATLARQRGETKDTHEGVTDRLRRLEAQIAELREGIAQRRAEEADSKRKGDALRGQVASVTGRRNSLEGLIRDHSYSTDTVKNLFRAAAKSASFGQQGATLGTLADLIEVEGAYEQVVDEFLRDELNYVVVKSWDAADAGVALLRSDVAGRATFLVESAAGLSTGRARVTVAFGEGVRPLTECVRVLNGLGPSLEAMLPKLREGYIVPDAATARKLAAAQPEGYFLTPTGETFHGLSVTAGRTSAGGPLALKRELKEVESKLADLAAELATTDKRTTELQHELAAQNGEIETRNAERRDAEREAANSGATLRQMEAETARIERRLQEWTAATDRNRAARNQKAEQIAARMAQAAELEAERAAQEGKLAELTSEVEDLRRQREELQQAAAEASAALAGLEERRRNAQANYEQTTRMYNQQQQRIGQLEQQLAAAANERLRREEETASLATQHEAAAEAKATALAQGSRLTEEAKALRVVTAELDAKLRVARAETEGLREQRAGLQARTAKLGADLEHMEATCLNDLAIPAVELRADKTAERIEGDVLQALEIESRLLKQRLESMGPVNMMALEEYDEAYQRHTFLESQRRDLLDSIENTVASIKEIDDVSRVKFDEAYKVINENFSVTFTKLFGGGHAFMRLTDPDNPNSDASGIEIVASPPGKKLQNILLLSGGEKALTALSLLVGIFQFQPAPFCILDEVDAPLDETNVGRFAKMIAEMSRTTQFIAITHNKRTMQEANVIYGVTMQEPGVSKIVSVSLGQGNRSGDARRVA